MPHLSFSHMWSQQTKVEFFFKRIELLPAFQAIYWKIKAVQCMNNFNKPNLWTEVTVALLKIFTEDNHFQRTKELSQSGVSCSTLNGFTYCLFIPENRHVLAFRNASVSGVIISSRQFQHSIRVREPWEQLRFIDAHYRENLFTKIRGFKHAQHICSEHCHVGVTWQDMPIKYIQARCKRFALHIWFTLQVLFQVGCWRADQKHSWWMESKKTFFEIAKNLKALFKLPQQSRCFIL